MAENAPVSLIPLEGRTGPRGAALRIVQYVTRGARTVSVFLLLLAIRAYQVGVRPLLVGSCKYHPHCSEYAVEAVQRHGPLRGGWLALRRLLRCHPWAAGGYDPVP